MYYLPKQIPKETKKMINTAFNPIQKNKQHVGFGINTTVTRELWEQLSPTAQKQAALLLNNLTKFSNDLSADFEQLPAVFFTGTGIPPTSRPTDVHGFITRRGKKFLGIFPAKEKSARVSISCEEFINDPLNAITKILCDGIDKLVPEGKIKKYSG